MPGLWSLIGSNLDTPIDPVLVKGWLIRLRKQPLEIYAIFSFQNTIPFSALKVVACYSDQWQHIIFELQIICYNALSHAQNHLPRLESIFVDKSLWQPSGRREKAIFMVSLQLCNVHIRCLNLQSILLPTT
jgi:hypothetical protein